MPSIRKKNKTTRRSSSILRPKRVNPEIFDHHNVRCSGISQNPVFSTPQTNVPELVEARLYQKSSEKNRVFTEIDYPLTLPKSPSSPLTPAKFDVPIASPIPLKPWSDMTMLLQNASVGSDLCFELSHGSASHSLPSCSLGLDNPTSDVKKATSDLSIPIVNSPLVPLENSWYALHPFSHTGSQTTVSLGSISCVPIAGPTPEDNCPTAHSHNVGSIPVFSAPPIRNSEAQSCYNPPCRTGMSLVCELEGIDWTKINFQEVIDVLEANKPRL